MNISEMFSTLGGKLFYGGIIGCAAAVILLIAFVPIFRGSKKRLQAKIEKEFEEK